MYASHVGSNFDIEEGDVYSLSLRSPSPPPPPPPASRSRQGSTARLSSRRTRCSSCSDADVAPDPSPGDRRSSSSPPPPPPPPQPFDARRQSFTPPLRTPLARQASGDDSEPSEPPPATPGTGGGQLRVIVPIALLLLDAQLSPVGVQSIFVLMPMANAAFSSLASFFERLFARLLAMKGTICSDVRISRESPASV